MTTSLRSILLTAATLGAVVSLPATAGAQVRALDRGSVQLGGSASLTITDNDDADDDTRTTLSLQPSALFFVARGLGIGGDAQIARVSEGDFGVTFYGIGPALAYYFVRDGDAHPFLRGSVRFGHSNPDGDNDGTSQFALRGAAGLLFLLNETVGIDASIYYDHMQVRSDFFDEDSNTFGLAVGIAAFVF